MLSSSVPILISALCISILSADFHLKANVSFPDISNITFLSFADNKLRIIQGDLTQGVISVFGGNDFSRQIKKIGFKNAIDYPIITSDSILFSDGDDLFNYRYTQESKKFASSTQLLNGVVYTQNKICASSNLQNAQVTVFDIKTNEMNVIMGDTVTIQLDSYIVDAGSGLLGIAKGNYFVTFDPIQKTTLDKYQISEEKTLKSASSYSQNMQNVTTTQYCLNYGNYSQMMAQKLGQQKQYKVQKLFFNPTSQIKMVGPNSGFSVENSSIFKWQRLHNQILSVVNSTDADMLFCFVTAINPEETQIWCNAGNYLYFYKFDDEKNYFSLKKAIDVTGFGVCYHGEYMLDESIIVFQNIIPNGKYEDYSRNCYLNTTGPSIWCRNISYTNDKQFYEQKLQSFQGTFLSGEELPEVDQKVHAENMRQLQNAKNKNIVKKMSENKQNLQATQQVYDCPFLFVYPEINKFVQICGLHFANKFQIHLISVPQLSIVKIQAFPVVDFRLQEISAFKHVGSPVPAFYINFKKTSSFDETFTLRYTIVNDNFVLTKPTSWDLSIQNTTYFGNYAATFKVKNKTYQSNALQLYDSQTFQHVASFPIEGLATLNKYMMIKTKNIVMINQIQGKKISHVFDLSKDALGNQSYRGSFFGGVYSGVIDEFLNKLASYIFLPKRQQLLFFRLLFDTSIPYQYYFNLNSLPITKQIKMFPNPDSAQLIRSVYVAPTSTRLCPSVITIHQLVASLTLSLYTFCENGTSALLQIQLNPQKRSFNLQFLREYTTLNVLSDGDKIGIAIPFTSNKTASEQWPDWNYQIRQISQNLKLIYTTNEWLPPKGLRWMDYRQIDNSINVYIGWNWGVDVKHIRNSTSAATYNVEKIVNVLQNQKCYVIGGYQTDNWVVQIKNTGEDLLEVKGGALLSKNQMKVYVSQSCKILGVFVSKELFQVWNVESVQKIKDFSISKNEVNLLQFVGDSSFKVSYLNGTIQDYSFTDTSSHRINLIHKINQVFHRHKVSTSASPILMANSPDGSILASSTDGLTITFTQNQSKQQIRTFTLPLKTQGSFSSLTFTQNNTVIVSTSQNNLYILDPTPCKTTYINVNAICTCRINQTESSSSCGCSNNFQQKGDICECDTSEFQYQNQKCFCSINSTQNLKTCPCHANFIKSGSQCTCNTRQFVYSAGYCQCHPAAKQEGDKCVCNQNYVKKGGLCLCPEQFIQDKTLRTCRCEDGQFPNNQQGICEYCSFPCKTCHKGGCDSFTAFFWILISIGVAIFIGGIVIFVKIMVQKKKGNQDEQEETMKTENKISARLTEQEDD